MTLCNLVIENSESRVEGLTIEQHNALKTVLSYNTAPKMNYYTNSFSGQMKYLIDKKGVFPSGLVPLVINTLKSVGAKFKISDARSVPISTSGLFHMSLDFQPYDFQLEAVDLSVKQGKGTIVMPTGTGKSITMALLMNALQVKTLLVVPSVNLKHQLKANFAKYFGDNNNNFTIENIDSPKLKKLTNFDCLIIDEAHHVAAKTYRQLNKTAWKSIYHRFFFTATPFRSRDEENILFESIAGQVIYTLDYHKAVKLGAICPMEAYYVEVPKTPIPSSTPQTWSAIYNALVVNNERRNDILRRLLTTMHDNNLSTICLVKEIKHGLNLLDDPYWFASGENENTPYLIEMFNKRQIKTLVATTGIMGEGIDSKCSEFIIIAGLGKSKNRLMQNFGRGFRRYEGKESCKIILIKDDSHKWTRQHYKEQVKILKDEYNCIPVKLEI